MTKQTDLIDELGGYKDVALSLCKIREGETDDVRLRRWVDRVRKWRDHDHIPHWARPFMRQLARAQDLPIPKELQEPQINAA